MSKKITHHELTAEIFTDDNGPAIMLTQLNGCDEPASVLLHPWQLRAVCEQFEIIPTDQYAAKLSATLERRLCALRERVETLHDYLCNNSDHKHADLTWEVTFATATLDIANEFCAGLEDDGGASHV